MADSDHWTQDGAPPREVVSGSAVTTPSAADEFYSSALERIANSMLGLAVVLTIAAVLRYGWRVALGFACGCALAYLNFHWLKRVVSALADRASGAEKPRSGSG